MLAAVLALVLAHAAPVRAAGSPPELSVGRAVAFLGSLLDPEVGLLKQHPGSKDYWLCPDNLLAAKALERTEAGKILAAALSRHGGQRSGKFQVLFGGTGPATAFFEPDLVTVSRPGAKRVRTEKPSSRKVERWNENADLLFLAALAEPKRDMGRAHFHRALRMWDGAGFLDKGVFHRQFYSAETLGLALLAADRLKSDLPMRPKILLQLARQQDASGGFVPDYARDGTATGPASAKTTSVVLLGLAAGP